MAGDFTQQWLSALGYEAGGAELYRRPEDVGREQPYAREILALLALNESFRPSAVVVIDEVPTVCFVEGAQADFAPMQLDAIRQQIWNQNLVSLVLVVQGDAVTPYPTRRDRAPEKNLELGLATVEGPYSIADVRSGDIQGRLPEWFALDSRVDRELLRNLQHAVSLLAPEAKKGKPQPELSSEDAQILVGRCLFVSYLEHREIIGEVYRWRAQV